MGWRNLVGGLLVVAGLAVAFLPGSFVELSFGRSAPIPGWAVGVPLAIAGLGLVAWDWNRAMQPPAPPAP